MSKVLLTVSRIMVGAIGLVLIVDCVLLIAAGKINFGTLVPLGLGVVLVIHSVYWRSIYNYMTKTRWLKYGWYSLWVLLLIWLISFALFIESLQQQIKRSAQPLPPVAAIIVLGSGTVAGKPTPTLAKRLDTAVTIIDAQPSAIIVTSGGIGYGRQRSEADIMASYLHTEHSLPFERILQEGTSTSTQENLANSKIILAAQEVDLAEPIAIVTSDFHIIRAAAIARHQGYEQPITVASPTPLSIRYNAWFREYFAFISGWLLGEY
ncbi:YdcF family protein [Psychrobacter urativorans]|uniref:YdcF family protein n=2 Tax=Psychrobacter urativorans TaxID=45610 RepID=UPI001917EE14|nr:YdcF family protein [Psychrobacter urativorans]